MVAPDEPRSGISQLRRGVLQFCVLAQLRDREKYAYELVRELCDTHGLVTSEGTIYPLLSRLRKDAWVSSFLRESEVGPARRYYALTSAGREALETFTSDWAQFRTAVDKLLDNEEDHR